MKDMDFAFGTLAKVSNSFCSFFNLRTQSRGTGAGPPDFVRLTTNNCGGRTLGPGSGRLLTRPVPAWPMLAGGLDTRASMWSTLRDVTHGDRIKFG
jgi:hypothetical protein